ncbi:MAG: hypothetical protein DHS20C18_42390 [Saprospiraceae bacterium]|nr:MAG: hypothetical protein DHS20C18_42390 [Saprospiraceae bacterium]
MRKQIENFLYSGGNPTYNNIVRWMWRISLAGVLGVIFLFIGLSFTNLPSVSELENPRSEEASQIFAANGEVLGRFYTENRVPVSFEELSPNLVKALIATEDERYYSHSGIDFEALGRVAVKTVLMGQKSSGGASTITQQLAKLLFTGEKASNLGKRAVQKLKEWIIAVRLERKYTKEEIIALYLNKFNFINGAYGIKAASEIYFRKSQKELTIEESAVLIGMLKNPSLFNPVRRPERVLDRRMVVLKQMQKNGLLSQQSYDSIRQLPLGLNFTRQTHIDGLAPYFRMELSKDIKDILSRKDKYKSDGEPYNIYKDGLKIYTTIDPDVQRIAEETMVKHMAKVQKTFWQTWRKLDPWTYKSGSDHEISVELRHQGLVGLIRNSDRYQDLREKYLGEILKELSQEVNLEFHDDDREIDRIIQESKKSGTFSKLVSQNMISSKLAAQYRKVLNNDLFPKLKTQWDILQEKVDEVFAKKVEMTVFAYNDQMETDTLLSPLDSIKYHRMFLQTGILAVDPITGYVKAWIGGINHKYFQYDHVRIARQVGSTFKPFVYATAIALQSFSPCYQVYDLPVTIKPGDGKFFLQKEWSPRNSDGKYTGELLTLKEGLKKSKNTVSVHLMKQLGSAEPVRNLVDQMGISKDAKHPNGQYLVPNSPSICLGATDLSVMQMTGAYTTFANNGIYNKPIFISRIEDKSGRELYSAIPEENVALNPGPNYVMLELLRYAGSGGMGILKSQMGGKTGTTNDYVDGWFMGITPNLVVGTWVGGEDKWVRFRNLLYGQGAYMAKPFFREFIKALENTPDIDYDASAKFYRPPGDLGIELDCAEYENGIVPLEEDDIFEDEFSEDIFQDEVSSKPDGSEDETNQENQR